MNHGCVTTDSGVRQNGMYEVAHVVTQSIVMSTPAKMIRRNQIMTAPKETGFIVRIILADAAAFVGC